MTTTFPRRALPHSYANEARLDRVPLAQCLGPRLRPAVLSLPHRSLVVATTGSILPSWQLRLQIGLSAAERTECAPNSRVRSAERVQAAASRVEEAVTNTRQELQGPRSDPFIGRRSSDSPADQPILRLRAASSPTGSPACGLVAKPARITMSRTCVNQGVKSKGGGSYFESLLPPERLQNGPANQSALYTFL
jgi:hypothetical protein